MTRRTAAPDRSPVKTAGERLPPDGAAVASADEEEAGLSAPQQCVVAPEHAGQRLDWVLGLQPGMVSREMGRRLIAAGRVTLNGEPAAGDRKVRAGDVIAYRIPAPTPIDAAPQAGPLEILYEDAVLVVINKPPGMPMHPGAGHPDGTLVNFLLGHCGDLSSIGGRLRPGIVHRLDMDTSGIVVVAKGDVAHAGLAAQFRTHTIERTYRALVLGSPADDKGTVALPLGRHGQHRLKRAVTEGGKHAVTHWWVERRLPPFCLLRVKLETGRTHQIRVHMAAQDWPVVGDPLYGGAARLRGLVLAEDVRAGLLGFKRQALHAAELGFVHPLTGERLHFTAPLPPDFQALLDLLLRAQPRRAASPRPEAPA